MSKLAEKYIRRCFDLARLGRGKVAPNPMVGAVIVHDEKIIGEGYHKKYGEAHAEVNAVNSIRAEDRDKLFQSTIYISLEPCCIHGNTPPCTELIIKNRIPRVVFSCLDQTAGVKGKSVEILRAAGCEVEVGILEKEGMELSKERSVFTTQNRPYIILKYAQSIDGFMGRKSQSVWLSNALSKRLTHKWRSEIDAIIVGRNTAQLDNPQLSNRYYFGDSPLRIVLDKNLQLAPDLHLFDKKQKTWVFNSQKNEMIEENLVYHQHAFDESLIPHILKKMHEHKYGILMVEGGKQLLESFIRLNLWDEARVLKTPKLLAEGLLAPLLPGAPVLEKRLVDDRLLIYQNKG